MSSLACTHAGSSPEKWGESLEELMTCPMTYTMCGLIIPRIPYSNTYKRYIVILDVTETIDWHLKAVSLVSS